MIGRNRGMETWTLGIVGGDDLPIVADTGSDDWQSSRPSPHGMTVQLREHPGDLRGALLRGTYKCDKGAFTIGTWVPTGLTRNIGDAGDTWTLSGVDTTVTLARIQLRRSLTLGTGTDVEQAARALLDLYLPGTPLAIVDTDSTLRLPLTWELGTPLLTALREILAAGGHELRPTRDGGYSAPLIGDVGREPVITWTDDQTGVPFLPEMELVDRLLDTPNEVLAVSPGANSVAGFVGRWADEVAIARFGRHTETIRVEAATQDVADQLAAKRGRELQRHAAELTVNGPWEPVDVGSTGELRWTGRDITRLVTITGTSTAWQPSAPTTYSVQEIR